VKASTRLGSRINFLIENTNKTICNHLTNQKGSKILYFKAKVLLLKGLFTLKLITDGLEIKFILARISIWKGLLFQSFTATTEV
jgi:hypothetical protein